MRTVIPIGVYSSNLEERLMTIYFNTYHPLCSTPRGINAIDRIGYDRFVDYSIRREPDFEHDYPSITSICRGKGFAPKLKEGDLVIYCTVQGKYLGFDEDHWCLVAVLEIIKKTDSHQQAADWYIFNGYGLPRNCIVPGNDPLPDSHAAKACNDNKYNERVTQNPCFLICKKRHVNIKIPCALFQKDLKTILGKVPTTRASAVPITEDQMSQLLSRCKITLGE